MPAKEIKEIKLQWQERLKEQQKKGFSEKEKSSLTETNSCSFLVKRKPPQPLK